MRNLSFVLLALLLSPLGCGEKHPFPSPPPSWIQTGTETQEFFGHKAAAVGDVTGAGYDDLLVGAPGYSNRRGRAFLYSGSADGLGNQSSWSVEGAQTGEAFGEVVGALGDLNADGFMDFFVAAPEFSTPKAKRCGRVYVYLGGPRGPGSKASWIAAGETANELFGDCAGVVGDVNGDGYPDLMIGAYGFDRFRGRVCLYLGSAKGFPRKPDWEMVGEGTGDWQGYGIGPAGDVNGDGYDDVLLGAKYHSRRLKNAGKIYLFYGSPKGLALTADWTREGETVDSRFGHHLSGTGDMNGDGYSDFVVGAPGYDHGRGRAYVFWGSSQGPREPPKAIAEGQVMGEAFGTDVAGADDVNGDGTMDLLISGPGFATFPGSGNLFLGSPRGIQTRPIYRVIGEVGGNSYGSIIGSAGDVNGDGIPDWFVCAPGFGSDPKEAGKVYLYQGARRVSPPFRVSLRRKLTKGLVGPGGVIRMGNDAPLLSFAAKGSMGEVKLQAEVREAGKPFDGKSLLTSDWISGGKGSLEVTGLEPGKSYRWRARLILPKENKVTPWILPAFWRLAGSPNFRTISEPKNR
jgi:hypothetical protein